MNSEFEGSKGAACAPCTPAEPPLARLYGAIEKLRKASGYTSEITNRLCGSVPGDKASGEQPMPCGVFNEIDEAANIISELAASVEGNMMRISHRL